MKRVTRRKIRSMWVSLGLEGLDLRLRELLFRAVCRHEQGSKPNILLFAIRRSGSTMVLNLIASHPGVRYVARPFATALRSRYRRQMPDLAEAAGFPGGPGGQSFIHFEGQAEQKFRRFAEKVISGKINILPSLRFGASHFHRVTDRVVYQMTNETAMIEWFDQQFEAATFLLLRHPIATGLSVLVRGWPPNCADYLNHRWFVETHLTAAQVDLARKVLREGSPLAVEVLDWTLKMLLPIRAVQSGRHPQWLVLTYEQAALDPKGFVGAVSERLDLPHQEPMFRQVREASPTTMPTSMENIGDKQLLIKRWRKQVSPDLERELMSIPAAFDLDVYQSGRFIIQEGITTIP